MSERSVFCPVIASQVCLLIKDMLVYMFVSCSRGILLCCCCCCCTGVGLGWLGGGCSCCFCGITAVE